MARPTKNEYRAAILGAFDTHMHRTIAEVNDYLREVGHFISDQSTRRMLQRMTNEHLLMELGKRGEKNALIYTKAIFSPHRMFTTLDGRNVTLKEFIGHVSQLDSKTISGPALAYLKRLLLDYLASTYPEPYKTRDTSPVAKEDVLRELNALASALSQWHSFIKNFLDNKIWDDFSRSQLGKQFKDECAVQHVAIIDRVWETNHGRSESS